MTNRLYTGTTEATFRLGLVGPRLHHGETVPDDVLGENGDLYVRTGSSPGLYSRLAGSWKSLREEETFVNAPVARGEILTVDPSATLVTVFRNPYTIDTIDMTIDTTVETIDSQPTNLHTTVVLPTGVEGQTLTIKDVSGLYEAFEIRVTGWVDDAVQASMTAISSKMELLFSGGSWRIVGR